MTPTTRLSHDLPEEVLAGTNRPVARTAWPEGAPAGTPSPLLAPPDERAARRDLLRQISRLEAALGAAFVEAPRPIVAPARRGGARLLSLAELERARNDLLTRVHALREAARAAEERHAAARALLEAMYADPEAHRWTRVSRDHLGLPGCGHYHVRPRRGLVGMLRGWWVVKVSSGCPLAT